MRAALALVVVVLTACTPRSPQGGGPTIQRSTTPSPDLANSRPDVNQLPTAQR